VAKGMRCCIILRHVEEELEVRVTRVTPCKAEVIQENEGKSWRFLRFSTYGGCRAARRGS